MSQIAKRLLMVSPRPVKIESIYASLSGIEEIKLPVITHMDDLTRLDAHLFTYPEVKIRAF
ncbi:unnamed protein product [marine sediment metagenome]|uniref:Uncharacterized protein n=1 Tax=marine sediment metagenome TaxID=412755 RepID=X0RWD1_9ZZZZ